MNESNKEQGTTSGIETVTISTPGREPITMTGEAFDDATTTPSGERVCT